MPGIIHILSSAIVSVVLIGCGKPSAEKMILGAWDWEAEGGTTKMSITFTKDHKWTQTVVGSSTSSPSSISASGTWKLEGNMLVRTVETTSSPLQNADKPERAEIVTPDDSVLVLGQESETGKEHRLRLRRVALK